MADDPKPPSVIPFVAVETASGQTSQQLPLPNVQQGIQVSIVQPAAPAQILATPENVKAAMDVITAQSQHGHEQAMQKLRDNSEARKQDRGYNFATLIVLVTAAVVLGVTGHTDAMKEIMAIGGAAFGAYGYAQKKKRDE